MRNIFVRLDEILTAVLLVALVIIVALQVIFRYLLYQPMSWTEEAGRYVFIWICLLGAAVGVKHRKHFGIDVMLKKISPDYAKRLLIIIDGLGLIFCGVLTWTGGFLVTVTMGQISPGINLPMSVPYLAVPIGGGLMTLYFLKHLWRNLRKKAH
jgi:TRAP-type C4-dicarboxylate transport system permease small subunit